MGTLLGFVTFFVGLLVLPQPAHSQPQTILYVNRTDPGCGGAVPCFTTIQAAINAASAGAIIRIQAGAYPERLTIDGKNNFAAATETSRIIIEADPSLAPGSVVLRPPSASCLNGQAVLIRRSKFITIRGLTITGATGAGVVLLGGAQQNQSIHIERSRIFGNSSSSCPGGGITIALGNPDTLIVNSLIHGNGGNGITFADPGGGPHWLIQNTIHGNGLNGVVLVLGHTVTLANNAITGNGLAAGTLGGRHGVTRLSLPWQAPESVRLLNNLICGNRLGEIQGPLLDSEDSGNLTPDGDEGPGVTNSAGCNTPANVYADLNGPDKIANTVDDEFSLAANSPAGDRGMDPRTLGLPVSFNTLFEDDFSSDFVRPSDSNGDRVLAFDIGALEIANRLPVADAEPDQTTYTGALVTVNGNQSYDPEGASLTYRWSLISQPAGSTLTLTNPTSATQQFTPVALGSYVLELVVNDGQFDSAPDSVRVDVINRAPTANNAVVSTNEDTPVSITLVAIDRDSGSLSFGILTAPSNGSLSAISTNCVALGTGSTCTATIVYTPAPNYSGGDIFTFRANDGTLDSNTASVSISVNPQDDRPTANDAQAVTSEDSPVSVSLTASDADSGNLSFGIVSGPNNGSLGSIPTPNCIPTGFGSSCTAAVIYSPAANYNGPDSFSFKVNDGSGDSNVATVSITVNAVNDAPVAHNAIATTDEDTAVAITLSATDVDSSTLSFAVVTPPENGSVGAISLSNCAPNLANCTATLSYTPAANYNGPDSFTFLVTDGGADSNVAIVSITVNQVNDGPEARDDAYTTDEDTPLILFAPGVLGNDNDLDTATSALTVSLVTAPTHAASFRVDPDGAFSYTPVADFSGTDSFTYRASDGTSESNVATVTISVSAVDDAPVATNDYYNTDEDVALEVPARGVLVNDNDLDTPAAAITAILVAAPAHAANFTLNPDGSFRYTPAANFNGTDTFSYNANDGNKDSNVAMVTIAVNAVNDSPVAQNDSYTVAEDSVLGIAAPGVLENDSDPDGSQTLTAELVSAPMRATAFRLDPDGSFNYTPAPDFYGVDTFTYRLSDGSSYSNVAMVQITVANVNDAPVAQSQSISTNENTPVIITLSAGDIDSTNLSFNIASGPSHGTLTITSGPMICTGEGQGSLCTASVGYSPIPNYSGADSLTFTVSDGVATSQPATVSFTIIHVNRAPEANAGGPYTGNVGVPIQFAGSGSDADGDSVNFFWDFGEGGTGSGPNPTYTYAAPGSYTVILTVIDPVGAQGVAQTSATINAGVILNPIGNKTVNLGETLTFAVSATNTSGGQVNLYVAPLPLMTNATFNAATGVFTFRPATTQVGTYQLTFTAVGGSNSASETISITVPNPPQGGTTGVRGLVHNLNNTPLANVKVTLRSSGHTGLTGADGVFTIDGVPSGTQQLIVNGREANLGVYAIIAVAVELIDGVLNDLSSAISLPDVDVDAEIQVSPTFTTVVSNPNLPGVELTIAGGTARNPDGTPFTGKLSINPVPDYGRPESRPEELRPGMAVTIQPAGIRFDPPARITFPNADGMPPGNELNLWSLSPDTGKFNIVGKSVVSADGQSIITVEGGVSASAWHFPLASSPVPNGSGGENFCGSCRTPVGSEANLEEGSLYVTHTLPSYRSLGQSRSVSLTYSSVTADPKPIISLDTSLSLRAAVPNTFSTRLKLGGVQQGAEVFTDARSLPEDADSSSRLSVQFDASNLPTGRYPYEATVFSNYLNSSIGGITNGNVIVVNRKNSPFGAGWAVTDVQQLHVQPGVGILLTSGDGSALFFSGTADTFVSPPRDFSTLVKSPDDTYVRTFKDGTKINFNSQGLQTSVVDRNGNATTHVYDASGRLESITDPVGLVTTFTYAAEKLQRITDPAGRETLLQFDSAGNLSRITNPDGSFLTYVYDTEGRLTQVTNEKGISTHYSHDFSGRFSQSVRPGGETRSLVSSKLQGLPNTGAGLGSPSKPAQIVRSENARASLTDGRGNTSWFTLDSLGQVIAQTDALGHSTFTQRDSNGLPTRITRPNGAITTMTYDGKGNLLTSTDPIGATTTFTYEPVFNQIKTIRDPKGNTTTINYDAKGNAIEIIDALGNRSQMTYDSRGLLTSVTSAVGTPVQLTNSFTYDAKGNLLTTTNGKGEVTTLAYDSTGNVARSTDAENRVTEFAYDPLNRLVSVWDAATNNTQYGYDARGNLIQVRDAKNQVTTFAYDGKDRMISATNPLGLTENFAYDNNGNLISTINRNGQTITFDYDALNRLISKARPPTSTEQGSQVTMFDYDSLGNLTKVSNPVTNIFNQYDLANRLVSTTSTSENVLANAPTQINSDMIISANDRQYDGRTLQVNGKVLTVDGSHQFANLILTNGAVLTHSPTTATSAGKLDVTVTGVLQIDTTSRIDVSGRGFLGGGQPGNPSSTHGMTVGFQPVNVSGVGGSYGGVGGTNGALSNPVYGDFRNPKEVGSGGGGFQGAPAGNGGGLVRIVAQSLVLNGRITANGGPAASGGGFGAGGSGGGIRLDVNNISGVGFITANGSAATPLAGGGGGGGGRVAMYYQTSTGFNFDNVTAFGAAFGGSSANGSAGTVYIQGPGSEAGDLILDNNNLIAATTPILPQSSGLLALQNLRLRRQAVVRVDDRLSIAAQLRIASSSSLTLRKDLQATSVDLTDNSVMTHAPTTATATFSLDVTTVSLAVDATSRIDVTGRGFLGGGQPGNPNPNLGMTVGFQAVNGSGTAGSYGGLGGVFGGTTNAAYGDFRNPNEGGSGGGGFNTNAAGNGGGLVRILAQTLTLNGVIRANGGAPLSGGFAAGGSGGGIRIDVGSLSGTGSIAANGSASTLSGGGGGGGGRIAIYYENLTGFSLGNISATGNLGSGSPNGGAGTVFLRGPGREVGELILDNKGVIAVSDTTPVFTIPNGSVNLTSLKIRRGAKAKAGTLLDIISDLEIVTDARLMASDRVFSSSITVGTRGDLEAVDVTAATSFQIVDNSSATHPPTTGTTMGKLVLNAVDLTVDSTSRIDVTGRGFLGGGQPGNPSSTHGMTLGFKAANGSGTAGSYGGLGGAFSGTTNPLYGDFMNPNEVGSGGGGFNGNRAGNGGGLVRIAAQTLTLNGAIRANGGAPQSGGFAAGGSGGGIRIDAGTFSGTGSVTANGSSSTPSGGGGGGGGRIAVYYQNAASFNLSAIVSAGGAGSGAPNGQSGSIHLQQRLAMVPAFEGARVMIASSSANEDNALDAGLGFTNAKEASHQPVDRRRRMLDMNSFHDHAEISPPTTEDPDQKTLLSLNTNDKSLRPHGLQSNLYVAMLSNNQSAPLLQPLAPDDLDPIYTYDQNGNRVAMIDPTGLTTYAYDALNRLTSMTNNKGQTTTFTYDALSRRTSLTHANAVVTEYAYDAASQLTRLSHQIGTTIINSFDYTYDKVGNRKSKTDANGTYNYTYDTLNRLTQALNPLPSNPLESFTYDPVGNRINSNQNGASTFNQANQLLEDANFTYQYDNNGNMTRKTAKAGGEITTFEYDAENRLTRVVSSTGTTSSYKYDGLGRRVEKEVVDGGSRITRYVYDKEDILLELDGSNVITARYTHGPGIDEPLIMEKSNEPFYYHADGLGSVTELTTRSGLVAQRYGYSSFGEIESKMDLNFVQPYSFTGRELDHETTLYYFRLRNYDSETARFMAEDPIGFSGGTNFFSFVGNNPVTRMDPYGLDWVDSTSSFTAGAGDFMTGGFMNVGGFSERVTGYRAVPLTQFARQFLGSDRVVDPCSTAYARGEYAGWAIGAAMIWSAGLNGGANTVFWSGYRQGAKNAAQSLGTTFEKTEIGALLDFISNNIVPLPTPIFVIASATLAANASGTAQAVIRNAGPIWSKVELRILTMRSIPIIRR